MSRQAIIDKEGYVKSLQQLQDDLNTAVQLSLPSKEKPYSKVGVLFVSWENDDLNVGPLEQELAEELKNCYQYDIDFIKLKSDPETVGSSLVKALNAHVDKYTRKGSLAIVVYNGHITGAENECLLA